jgi:hypothetical protein
MTANQLIEALKSVPPNTKVFFNCEDYPMEVDSVTPGKITRLGYVRISGLDRYVGEIVVVLGL